MLSKSCGLLLAVVAGLCGASAIAGGDPNVGTSYDPLKVAPPPASRAAPGSCRQGFVWREARRGDTVCVTPQTRDEVAAQNRGAARLWINGAYGPHTCRQGYVWREAFDGDTVCVPPEVRERTRHDNANAARRRAGS